MLKYEKKQREREKKRDVLSPILVELHFLAHCQLTMDSGGGGAYCAVVC